MDTDSKAHCKRVVKAITHGRLVPFLGAGANLCDRPEGTAWDPAERVCLPSGEELARYIAREFRYPQEGDQRKEEEHTAGKEPSESEPDTKPSYGSPDLARVSQYAVVKTSRQLLYDELHDLFDAAYPSTGLHDFLASLPGILRRAGYPRTSDRNRRRLLIVTTNYDDLLERAFHAQGEKFHVITYMAGDEQGRFLHWPANGWPPTGEPKVIDLPNQYTGLQEREALPVILKIHGAVDRRNAERDSFVITEDNYIEYLARTNIENLIPVELIEKLEESHFLFLGYSLKDWNLRVFLHRIWGNRKFGWKSWAIQLNPDKIDREFWEDRDVSILDMHLDKFITALRQDVEELNPAGGPA